MFHKLLCVSTQNSIGYLELVPAKNIYRKIFGDSGGSNTSVYGAVAPWWTMTINGQPSNQDIDGTLELQRGDVIRVNHGGSGGLFASDACDFSEVRGALPINNVAYATSTFYLCRSLRTVPVELFANFNGKRAQFSNTFDSCGIEEIPHGLFADLRVPEVSFWRTFYGCSKLKTIDINEFAHFKNISSLFGMFSGCDFTSQIHLRFTATDVSDSDGTLQFASYVPDGAITLYLPRGSELARKMKADNPNVNVVEE